MSRKDRDDSIWLSEHSDKRRIRDAENARQNRAEITRALSHGQIRRRDLVKWGLFTSAGIMLPIGGLNPFVRPLHGQTAAPAKPSRSAILASESDNQGIPTGLPASPTFGLQTTEDIRLYFKPWLRENHCGGRAWKGLILPEQDPVKSPNIFLQAQRRLAKG